jgi:hypothetical protein
MSGRLGKTRAIYEAGTVNVSEVTVIVSLSLTETLDKLMSDPEVPTEQRKISVFALFRNSASATVDGFELPETVPAAIVAAVATPEEAAPKAVAAMLQVARVAGAEVLKAMSPVASPEAPSMRSTIASQAALRAAVVRITAIVVSWS